MVHNNSRRNATRNRASSSQSAVNPVSTRPLAQGSSNDDAPTPSSAPNGLRVCGVCAEERSDWAIGDCGHRVCAFCAHRMRVLYKNRACAFCKMDLDIVLVPARDDMESAYDDVRRRGRAWALDEQSRIEFELPAKRAFFEKIRHPQCPMCRQPAASVEEVRFHLRNVHKRILCDVCLDNRKAFLGEQLVFVEHGKASSAAGQRKGGVSLRQHLSEEHTHCNFCRKHYYDESTLFDHLTREHFACDVCERQGRSYQYFKNFAGLERHYRHDHFMCEETACRGIAFATPLELKVHIKQTHGESSRTDRARQLTINLAELHDAAVASGASIRRGRDRGGQSATSRVSEEEYTRQRQNFDSSNVVFHAEAGEQQQSQSENRRSAEGGESGGRRFVLSESPETPDEALERNRALITVLRERLDPASYEQFQEASGMFRLREKSAKDFFDYVVQLFGSAGSLDILPELIALLPEAELRAALTDVVVQVHGAPESRARPRAQGPAPRNARNASEPSGEAQFPALGDASSNSRPRGRAWAQTPGAPASREAEFPSLAGTVQAQRPARPQWEVPKQEVPPDNPRRAAAEEPARQPARAEFPSLGASSSAPGLADPNMRVGAVWGGAGRKAYQRPQSRRTPAPAPVLDPGPVQEVSPADAYPSLPSGPQAGESSDAGTSSRPGTAMPESVGRGKVIDVSAIARERRQKISNSAVPKIGANGLPWEKKKNRANVKAAKEDLREKEGRDGAGPSGSANTLR